MLKFTKCLTTSRKDQDQCSRFWSEALLISIASFLRANTNGYNWP